MEEFTGREDAGKLLNRNVLLNAVNSLVSHHPWCTEDKVAAYGKNQRISPVLDWLINNCKKILLYQKRLLTRSCRYERLDCNYTGSGRSTSLIIRLWFSWKITQVTLSAPSGQTLVTENVVITVYSCGFMVVNTSFSVKAVTRSPLLGACNSHNIGEF